MVSLMEKRYSTRQSDINYSTEQCAILYEEIKVRETEKMLLSKMPDQNDEQHRKYYLDSLCVFSIDGNDSRD